MKKIGFIDLGSNSARFVIYEIKDNESFHMIYQQKESIRLGEGLFEKNMLTPEAMERGITTLRGFVKMAKRMGVEEIFAIATAAVRIAKNGPAFITRVKDELDLTLRTISGEEEASLGFLGVINTISLKDFVLFDLGGASVEVSVVKNRKRIHSYSFPMGAVTLTEKFQSGKEYSEAERKEMEKFILRQFSEMKWLKNTKLPVIGIGGTVRNLAKIHQRSTEYPIPRVHAYQMEATAVDKIFNEISQKSLGQRKRISGLSTERADIIVAGTAIIRTLLRYTQSNMLVISGSGLREGLFYEFYGDRYKNSNPIIEDIIAFSTKNFLHSFDNQDLEHVYYITNLAITLFHQWQPLHQLPKEWEKYLLVASLLHDIGKEINYYSHERHSAYMLLNANLSGLSHQEQSIAAYIANYSHGSFDRIAKTFISANLLSDEEWQIISKLGVILACAEALDESHEQGIKSVLTHFPKKDSVVLECVYNEDMNLDIIKPSLEKLKKSFKKEFGATLICKWIHLHG